MHFVWILEEHTSPAHLYPFLSWFGTIKWFCPSYLRSSEIQFIVVFERDIVRLPIPFGGTRYLVRYISTKVPLNSNYDMGSNCLYKIDAFTLEAFDKQLKIDHRHFFLLILILYLDISSRWVQPINRSVYIFFLSWKSFHVSYRQRSILEIKVPEL